MSIDAIVVTDDPQLRIAFCERVSQDSAGRHIRCEGLSLAESASGIGTLQPCVVVLHCGVDKAGLDAACELAKLRPHPRLLFLGDTPTPDGVAKAVAAGARGWLRVEDPPALAAKAIRCVHDGEAWFARNLLLAALTTSPVPPLIRFEQARLTPREGQVLDLIGSGLSNKEIARRLDISDKTVKTHLHRVYVKLNQSGRYKALLTKGPATPSVLNWLAQGGQDEPRN